MIEDVAEFKTSPQKRAYCKEYYASHKAHKLATCKKYYERKKAEGWIQPYDENAKHKKRAYYLSNKERIIAARRAHYAKHGDRLRAEQRQRHQTHPLTDQKKQLRNQTSKKWALENKERVNLMARLRYRKNVERARVMGAAHAARRRARQRNTQIDPAGIAAWMREVRSKPFARCHWCGTKVCGRKIHFDHIVALALGGSHTIGNLCASCLDCNKSKKAKAITAWVCAGQTFLNL